MVPVPSPYGAPSTNAWAASRISARPVSSPIGLAPARHSLIPLYWAGLWLAVNIAPGTSR
jgi:hypothetical protein